MEYLDKNNNISLIAKKVDSKRNLYIVIFKNPFVTLPINDVIENVEGYDIVDLEQKHLEVINKISSDTYVKDIIEWSLENDDYCADKEEYIENEDWTHCGNVFNYIAYLWGAPAKSLYPRSFNIVSTTWKLLSEMRGVFQITVNSFYYESHHFVIYIKSKNVTIYQGYGGITQASWISTSRKKFFEAILDKSLEESKRYKRIYKLFGVTTNIREFNENINFSEEIFYSRLY